MMNLKFTQSVIEKCNILKETFFKAQLKQDIPNHRFKLCLNVEQTTFS